MALRINTNIAALNAHKNLIKTDNSLSESLGRLSSGLRINKAADDASGMAIADSLRSQALGLGQAIRNGNDGIAIVQTADAALEESINIVNTIKQKAIQSAQDGQTTESRNAIQSDISKLRDELDTIAKTTAFNNQKLLSGNFTDKKFQIGAYAGETIDVSISSTKATDMGHITTSNLTFSGAGVTELNIYSNLMDETFSLKATELAFDNDAEHGVGAIADIINQLSDVLGISATASVSTSTDSNIVAGTTDSDFAINGVVIGEVEVVINDDGKGLVNAINNKTNQHGVTASVDTEGILTLISADARAIEVTAGDATQAVLGGTEDMSTLGTIEVRQEGTSQITITDANAQAGIAVSVADGLIETGSGVSGAAFTLTAGSSFSSGSYLASGTEVEGSITIVGTVETSGGTSIAATGSTIECGSTIGCGVTLQGSFTLAAGATASTSDETLAAGSALVCGTNISSGSVFQGDVTSYLSGTAAGSVHLSGDGNTYVSAGADVKVGGLSGGFMYGAVLTCGSTIGSGSTLTAGSLIESDYVTIGETTLTGDMSLGCGSSLLCGTVLLTGSVMASEITSGHGTVTATMTFTTGSLLSSGSQIANGSTLGSTLVLADDEIVADDNKMLLAGGSGTILDSGSVITAGTVLTNQILDENGVFYEAGTTLEYDITTGSGVFLANDMVLNAGSILRAGTSLHANTIAADDTVTSDTSESVGYRLSDVDVTSQAGAQIGIAVADAALKSLDKVRSDLGSVQNQLVSTIANISTTQINVTAAESAIRDVDFAAESSNFTKMQILSQAGTFALSQANATSQNVLSLLQ
ncbi:MAG: flagellar protein FlaB [Desulfobacteraceae bacterium]|nr:flagellar protein FlaB [Desulfobacteraceae bacterium]